MFTADHFNRIGVDHLPGRLGIVITHVGPFEVRSELPVHSSLMAPNGFLHAASVIALADTSAGYGCVANLPKGASGFITVELKSNHLGTATEGTIECVVSVANLIGLGAARQLRCEKSDFDPSRDGVAGLRKPRICGSTQLHHVIHRAPAVLGLGRRSVLELPADESCCLDPIVLRDQLKRDRAAGFTPVAVVATAGSVNTGAVDPIRAISEICYEQQVWLHVDSAYEGFGVLNTQALASGASIHAVWHGAQWRVRDPPLFHQSANGGAGRRRPETGGRTPRSGSLGGASARPSSCAERVNSATSPSSRQPAPSCGARSRRSGTEPPTNRTPNTSESETLA